MRRVVLMAWAALLTGCAALLTGCAVEQDRTLRVFAAASLEGVFSQLADSFEADHEGVSVDLHIAGSSDLVTQIVEGAPADVVATADEPTMRRLTDEERITGGTEVFAQNTLTMITGQGNPHRLTEPADLAEEDLDVVLCAPQVPCGRASQELLQAAGVEVTAVSEEHRVTDVLGKVSSGQADAGLVYVTDAASADEQITRIDIPGEPSAGTVNRYPIGVLDDTRNREDAEAFIDHVTSEAGGTALRDAGFTLPGGGG